MRKVLVMFTAVTLAILSRAERVLVVGDSITGLGENAAHGYAKQVRAALALAGRTHALEVVCLGGSGQTTASWLNVVKSSTAKKPLFLDIKAIDVAAELDRGGDSLVIFLGMNDSLSCAIDFDSIATLKQNLQKLIDALRQRTSFKRLFLATPTFYTEDPTDYRNRLMDAFAAAYAEVAAANQATLLPMREEYRHWWTLGRMGNLVGFRITCDYVHPNEAGQFAIAEALLKAFGETAAAAAYAKANAVRLFGSAAEGKPGFRLAIEQGSMPLVLVGEANAPIQSVTASVHAVPKVTGQMFRLTLYPKSLPMDRESPVRVTVQFADGTKISRVMELQAPWQVACGYKQEGFGYDYWHPQYGFATNLVGGVERYETAQDRAILAGQPFGKIFPRTSWYYPTVDHCGFGAIGALDFCSLTGGQLLETCYARREIDCPVDGPVQLRISRTTFAGSVKAVAFVDGKRVGSIVLGVPGGSAGGVIPLVLKKGTHDCVIKVVHATWQFALAIEVVQNVSGLADPGAVRAEVLADPDGGWEINGWQTEERPAAGEAMFQLSFLTALTNATVITYRENQLGVQAATGAVWKTAVPLKLAQAEGEGCSSAGSQWQFGSGRAAYRARMDFVTVLPFAGENIAPLAGVTVSSAGESGQGRFFVKGWVNKPETLVDGFVDDNENFSTAERKMPISSESPEWIQLTWEAEQTLKALATLRGRGEPGAGAARVEIYEGAEDPRFDRAHWREIQGVWSAPKHFRSCSAFDFGSEVKTLAVRLTCTGGVERVRLGEILAFGKVGSAVRARQGELPISFTIPGEGKVSIQIRDEKGAVVANPVSGVSFAAGKHTVNWNLMDIEGRLVMQPGRYRWHGLYVPELQVEYDYTYYPFPLAHVAWQTPDRKGGWMADHEPPRTICRIGKTMWLGAFAEMGDSMVEADLDGNKLWGVDRLWVAIPTEICGGDDGLYYGFCAGGWIGDSYAILQIDPATKENRRVFFQEHVTGSKNGFGSLTEKSVSGFQVLGKRAFVSFAAANQILVYDISKGLAAARETFSWDRYQKTNEELKPVQLREIKLASPGRLRRYGEGKLVTTSGKDIVLIDAESGTVTPFIRNAVANPLGLGTDEQGNVYVGEGEPLHQVFGFKPDGTKFLTLGKPGKRRIGAFDANDLEEPFGVEVAADGRIWVAEHTDWTRRVSIWNPKTGTCDKAIYGPTQYGGDGCLDPADETRAFYKGLEFKRDPATGRVTPVALNYRPANGFASFPRRAGEGYMGGLADHDDGNYPSYAFRANGRLWFTSYGYPHGHPVLVLWVYTNSIVKPVAAVGSSFVLRHSFGEPLPKKGEKEEDCSFLSRHLAGATAADTLFAWTDLNDDGNVQTNELAVGSLRYDGNPVTGAMSMWNWRMNGQFLAAANAAGVKDRMMFFKPRGFTAAGYPLYALPKETFEGSGMGLMPDGAGNAIVLGKPVRSISSAGKTRWVYRNEWPGLHAGHKATARGDEPGVLIAPTRMWGVVPSGGAAGEVAVFNSNNGCTYLMTAEDGLYIDRIFADQRVGLLWNSPVPPAPDVLKKTSLYDEHFGGLIQTTIGPDGRKKIVYVVGKNHCSVVELKGLERIQRLAGGELEVTTNVIAEAVARESRRVLAKSQPKRYTVRRVDPGVIQVDARANDWQQERINGFALAYDESNLYVFYQGADENEVFQNRGVNPLELFKTGDVLDVMLATKPQANPRRQEGGEGDERISFSMFNGKPVCVLYEAKVPGYTGNRVPFSSPVRTVWFDRVGVVESAKIAVARTGNRLTFEAAVPLIALGLNPKMLPRTRGDVGVVAGDATSTRALSRTYWSNQNTVIMSDLPSEAALQPLMWGEFDFE